MRRLLMIATFSVLVALPAWSQRGGGGHMMGGRAGFSHGPAFGGHSGMGVRQPTFAGHNSVFIGSRFGRFGRPFGPRFFPARFHNRFFFSVGLGFPLAYPYYYGGYYPSYYSYPPTYAYPPAYDDGGDSEERRRLEYEIERLNQKIDRLAAERENSQPTGPENRQLSRQDTAGKPKTVMLVFRDKHVQEVENYAIVGNTLWWFSEQRAKKIPLSDLDLVATAKLNDERGTTFVLPPPAKKK
jgi:hypothetical protein